MKKLKEQYGDASANSKLKNKNMTGGNLMKDFK